MEKYLYTLVRYGDNTNVSIGKSIKDITDGDGVRYNIHVQGLEFSNITQEQFDLLRNILNEASMLNASPIMPPRFNRF